MDSFDLLTCVDLCSSFHPRCDGASFDGRTCSLRARLSPASSRGNRRLDSAVGVFPGATSNCGSLSGIQSAGGNSFQIMCGTVIAGSDLVQNFAPTFQDCMGQCAATSGCAAVSFEASQDQGFKNCYLKSAVADGSTVVPDGRVDTAMIQGAGNAAPAGSGSSPGVVTIPLPVPAATTGTGLVFFTPPGSQPTISVGPLVPGQPGQVQPSFGAPGFVPTTTGGVSPTLFFPGLNGGSGSGTNLVATSSPDTAAQDNANEESSNAWIAAPVVGSVAAIALIVLSFIMLKRRRLGNRNGVESSNSSTDSLPRKRNISRPMAISSLFSSWLPMVRRKGDRGSSASSGSRGRMGNFSEVTGKQPASRGSMRTSVTGLVRPGLAIGERLEDVDETGERRDSARKADLRNSMNGLGQNRWS